MATGPHRRWWSALAALTAILITATRPAHTALIPEFSDGPDQTVAANVVSSMEEGSPALAGTAHRRPASRGRRPLSCLLGDGCRPGGVGSGRCRRVGTPVRLWSMRVSRFRTLVGGVSTVLSERRTSAIVGLGGVKAIVEGALDVLLVVLAIELLGIGEPGVGYLGAIVGVGASVRRHGSAGLVGRPRLAPSLLAGALAGGMSISADRAPPGSSTAAGGHGWGWRSGRCRRPHAPAAPGIAGGHGPCLWGSRGACDGRARRWRPAAPRFSSIWVGGRAAWWSSDCCYRWRRSSDGP